MNAKRIVNTDPSAPVPADTIGILESVIEERDRAMQTWGVQAHEDGTADSRLNQASRDRQRDKVNFLSSAGRENWFDILLEEVKEVRAEVDLVALDKELCQVMQVCLVWREDLWRRMASADGPEEGAEMQAVQDGLTEKAMREFAGQWKQSPALVSLAAGQFPGRRYLLDNIYSLQTVVGGNDQLRLSELEEWVQKLPASWWHANAANPGDYFGSEGMDGNPEKG